MTDFVWNVKNGDLTQVKKDIEQGCDVNAMFEGRYPIHYAADYGQTEVIRCLIDHGAQIDVKDKHGITPILAAVWEGHTESVKLLLEKGAKKNGKAPDGSSYIDCADSDEIKALLK
ncbi:hypothetical protein CHS0354_021315 [Potamilus streckersoni]|uniref:Myotrophin n=1 Tax=Potamilus streckersoni TaxID=2493646 RepID=A0AAE0WF91_9BIVA|nr:hypothetical protein CHS0354_021315 [Potamilus streckersoni]